MQRFAVVIKLVSAFFVSQARHVECPEFYHKLRCGIYFFILRREKIFFRILTIFLNGDKVFLNR